jgi:hypothetical protein
LGASSPNRPVKNVCIIRHAKELPLGDFVALRSQIYFRGSSLMAKPVVAVDKVRIATRAWCHCVGHGEPAAHTDPVD